VQLQQTVAVLERGSVGGGGEIVAGCGGRLAGNQSDDGAVQYAVVTQRVDALEADLRPPHHRQIFVFEDHSAPRSRVPLYTPQHRHH